MENFQVPQHAINGGHFTMSVHRSPALMVDKKIKKLFVSKASKRASPFAQSQTLILPLKKRGMAWVVRRGVRLSILVV